MVDTKLGGFNIPKDTAVLASLYALHMSKEVWKNPENFRPERFLNLRGELSLKYDKSLPFGGIIFLINPIIHVEWLTAIFFYFIFNRRQEIVCWRDFCKKHHFSLCYLNFTKF